MKKVLKKYRDLHNEFVAMQKIQCVIEGERLESIADSCEVEKLKSLGVYSPGKKFVEQNSKDISEYWKRTYDLTCVLVGLYDFIEEEDPDLAAKISRYHSGIPRLNEVLGKHFLDSLS